MNFKQYFLLREQVKQTDIIDAYILMAMPEIDDPAAQFIKKEIIQDAKANIIEELENIITKEFLHVRDQEFCEDVQKIKEFLTFESEPWDTDGVVVTPKSIIKQKDLKTKQKLIKNFLHDFNVSYTYYDNKNKQQKLNIDNFNRFSRVFSLPIVQDIADVFEHYDDYKQSIDNVYSTTLKQKKVSLPEMYKAFKILKWNDYYGGESWANITEHVIRIINAKTSAETFKHLGRLVDFVHNTGSILSKFKGYQEGWIQFILDIKDKAINIRELIPYATPEVQKMFKSSEWREYLKFIPGEGAGTSIESYKFLVPRYINRLSELLEGDPEKGEIDAIRYIDALGQIINKLGKQRVEEILHNVPGKQIAKATVAAHIFINKDRSHARRIIQNMNFLRSYSERNHPDLTRKEINEIESAMQ